MSSVVSYLCRQKAVVGINELYENFFIFFQCVIISSFSKLK